MVSAWKKLGKFQFELIIITLCDCEVYTDYNAMIGLLICFLLHQRTTEILALLGRKCGDGGDSAPHYYLPNQL